MWEVKIVLNKDKKITKGEVESSIEAQNKEKKILDSNKN